MSSTAQERAEHVRHLIDRGAYPEAEREAAALSADVALEHGQDSIEFARVSDLLVEALLRNGRTGAAATFALADRAVTLKSRLLGAEHLETAVSLHNLGDLYLARGQFDEALARHERGFAIRLRQLQPDSSAVADSLDRRGAVLTSMERFDAARQSLNRAKAVRELRAVSEPLPLARTLELIAWLERSRADVESARAVLDRVMAIRRRHSPDHPDVASLIKLQGDLLYFAGDLKKAQSAWAEGSALIDRTLGPNHPAAVSLQRRLALALDRIGNRQEARLLQDRALQLAESVFAQCNPDLLGLRSDFADSLTYAGEYTQAHRTYVRALKSFEDCLGVANSRTATVVHNFGLLLTEMGDFAQAERLHDRTLRAWSARLGPTHRYVARALSGLAEAAAALGRRNDARLLYERALKTRRATDKDHPDVAWTLTNLARLTADAGDLVLASRYVDEAVQIFRKTDSSDEPDHFARVLALRGDIERRRGNQRSARSSFVEALSERERIFGAAHPLVAESRAALAATDLDLGSHDAALAGALDAERAGREHLQFTVRYLPERQAMAYAAKRPKALELALSIGAAGAARYESILDSVIRSRGVILDELAARSRASSTAGAQAGELNTAAVQARQRFANLVVRSLQEPVASDLLSEARQQKEDAERALAESSAEARAEMRRATVGFKDVAAALPPGSVLVSLLRYDLSRAPTPGQRQPPKPIASYAGFVYRTGSEEPAFVPLGTASRLDGLVAAWRAEASARGPGGIPTTANAARTYRRAAVNLRIAAWDPLVPHLMGASRIFIVPDGLLNVVNFAALPGPDGRYLVEGEAAIHYLSTERDLVAPALEASRRSLLAVGGAAFGGTAPTASVSARRSGCEGLAGLHFEDLPGSRREVGELGKLWPTLGSDDVKLLSGPQATETAVKRSLSGRSVIHLATHGFFLGECSPPLQGTRSVGGLTPRVKPAPTVVENPLLLAGLAFAGANRRRTAAGQEDDGILTAEEIGSLNLHGTEWAVLSACDTGLGEIKAGEGVFGLRRAFQIAGARTVIMSLWSVEDRSAMEWMRALYEGRLRRNLTTADAVREASLTVLRQRRARGQSTHPFFWAGFVASGDWR